jgi:hypothetical protein
MPLFNTMAVVNAVLALAQAIAVQAPIACAAGLRRTLAELPGLAADARQDVRSALAQPGHPQPVPRWRPVNHVDATRRLRAPLTVNQPPL